MAFVPPKKLKPGVLPTATDFNALRAQLYALGRPTGGGQIGVEQSGYGLQITDLRPSRMLARITARGDGAAGQPLYAYGWNLVVDNGDGTYSDGPTDTTNAPWGTPAAGPAYELGNRTDVPTDGSVVVELIPGNQDAAAFYFTYSAAGVEFVLVNPLVRNADGDYQGTVQVFDPATDSWSAGETVWVRDAN